MAPMKTFKKGDVVAMLVLTGIVALVFLLANGPKIATYPPASIHQWRQSDCAAYARVYYERGNGLFFPATYNLAGIEGRVVSELPVFYYIGAKICYFTGFHYWIFRTLTFLSYLLGLFYVYKIARLWIKNIWLALFPAIMLATSPFYYYYALNFLPNVPAIAFSFMGLFYMLAFWQGGNVKKLVVATLIFILSVNLKPTDGGLAWLSFLFAVVAISLFYKSEYDKGRAKAIYFSSAIIALSILCWYLYATWYNDKNLNHGNLLGTYSAWGLTHSTIMYTINQRVLKYWFPSYHHIAVLVAWGVCVLICAVRWRGMNHLLKLLSLCAFIGSFAYGVLWFRAFCDHDYYQLIYVVWPTLLGITVLEYYERSILPRAANIGRYTVVIILLLLVVAGVVQNTEQQQWRYSSENMQFNMHLYDMEPMLERWGVAKMDKVVCVPDPSGNITLTAIGHQGYTQCFNESSNMSTLRDLGAKYLVIVDSACLHDPLYEAFTHKLVGTYHGINVFEIK